MDAKRFLKQVRKLDLLIENKLVERSQWKAIAYGTTANPCDEKVQTSGNPQRMSDAICKYIDIEKEIDRCIDAFVDAKNEVIQVIEQLPPTEYDLLHKVYIQNITLDVVAAMYDKSYSWATTVHGRALQSVQRILNEMRKDDEE